MSVIVKAILLCIAMSGVSSSQLDGAQNGNQHHNGSNHTDASGDMRNAVTNFQISESGFQVFRGTVLYRKSLRLEVLPGFPENPNLDQSILELSQDAGTLDRLVQGNMTPRDYVLTGWALILAHDPADWGLSGDLLTPSMRRNIAFVEAHRESVDALLRD